jgi:hypothetical protein
MPVLNPSEVFFARSLRSQATHANDDMWREAGRGVGCYPHSFHHSPIHRPLLGAWGGGRAIGGSLLAGNPAKTQPPVMVGTSYLFIFMAGTYPHEPAPRKDTFFSYEGLRGLTFSHRVGLLKYQAYQDY